MLSMFDFLVHLKPGNHFMRLKTKQVGTVGTVSTYLGPKRMETVSSAQRYYAPKTQQIRNRLKPFQTVSGTFL